MWNTIVAAAALVVILLVWWRPAHNRLTIDPSGRMQLWKAVLLLVYLLAASSLIPYSVVTLWAVQFADNPQAPAAEPECATPAAGAAPPPPEVRQLDPGSIVLGSSRTAVRVLGCYFAGDDKVRFDGAERPTQFVSNRQLLVKLASSDFGTAGVIAVSVFRAPDISSTMNQVLYVTSAFLVTGEWRIFGFRSQLDQEVRFLLLVLLTGAFGSTLYALKSLADYIGQRQLHESWFTYYVIQPLGGAGIAFVFYVLMRGGLLAGSTTDIQAVNVFGVSAVAVLVGVFSDRSFAKLREVFDVLFKPGDDRKDKIPDPAIQAPSPIPDAVAGSEYKLELTVTDGKPPHTWSMLTPLPDGLHIDKNTGVIAGTPSQAKPRAQYTVKVQDALGRVGQKEIEFAVVEAPPIPDISVPGGPAA